MSFTPPKLSLPACRRGRQLVVFMALVGVLLGISRSADAEVCEADNSEPVLMSVVAEAEPVRSELVFAPVMISAAPVALHCDAVNQDCDMNLPQGAPQPPRPTTSLRSDAGLAQSMGALPEVPSPDRARFASPDARCRPGYPSSLFRPPRSR